MALRSCSSISRHLTVGSSRRALGRSSFSVMQRRGEQRRGLLRLVSDIRAEPAAVGCCLEPGNDELAEQRDGGAGCARRRKKAPRSPAERCGNADVRPPRPSEVRVKSAEVQEPARLRVATVASPSRTVKTPLE
jgi:hypothetical protein